MVLHACRRLLARTEDAEDAFQATFLALVRRAGRISRGEALAGWLHTVACRAALRARAAAKRRTGCEERRRAVNADSNGQSLAAPQPLDPVVWAELRELLDQEVSRLPAKLRDPFVLCYLEGLSNDEAARQMGCPKGTVLSRLARARERLRGRLGRRGLGLPAAALAATLAQEAIASAPPLNLVGSTVKAATLIAAGQALAGVVSAPVAALTEGVLQAMFITKLKIVVAVVVGVGIIAAGSGRLLPPPQAAAQVGEPLAAQKSTTTSPKTPVPKAETVSDAALAALMLEQTKARLATAEQQLANMQDRIRVLQFEIDRAKADYEAARTALALAQKKGSGSEGSNVTFVPPKKDPPASSVPATSDKPLAMSATGQTDLIQLATAYIDAVRDWETAKAKLAGMENSPTPVGQREIAHINARAAERKRDLLRAIILGMQRGAEIELQSLRRQVERGIIPASRANEMQTKADVLQMILGSAK
jgi:RNA polymerase sigma factor (sigma-70 family)